VANTQEERIGFDNGVASFLLVYQVMSLDGWNDGIMVPVVQSTSIISVLFFVLVIVTLVFLVINLFVAVITTSFMSNDESIESSDMLHDGNAQHGMINKSSACYLGKMNKEQEEKHAYMVLGTTIAVDKAKRRGSLAKLRLLKLPASVSSSSNKYLESGGSDEDLTETNDPALVVDENSIVQSLINDKVSNINNRHIAVATAVGFLEKNPSISEYAILKQGNNELISLRIKIQKEHKKLRSSALRHFLLSDKFNDIVTVVIFLNTIALMIEHADMPELLVQTFAVMESIFAILFALELALRFYAFQR